VPRRKKVEIGDLVEVNWLDAVGLTNQPRSKARPAAVTNIGKLIADERTHIVLETGIYHGDGDDPDGDFTVIPKGIGWIKCIRRLT